MTEQEPDNSYPPKIGRRRFNTLMVNVGITALASFFGARDIINPDREDPLYEYEPISESTKSELLRYSPTTVFHNAMNNMERFDTALNSMPDFIDVDVIQIEGKIYASHNPYHGIPIVEPLVELIPNVIGPFKPTFEGIAKTAAKNYQPLYIDLKDLREKDFRTMQEIIREHEVEKTAIFSSKKWDLLDYAKTIYGPKKVVYSIGNQESLDRFFDRDDRNGNVSLAQHLATEENIHSLKENGKVFIYTINNSQDALHVLRNGADGIVTENLSLLGVYARKL